MKIYRVTDEFAVGLEELWIPTKKRAMEWARGHDHIGTTVIEFDIGDKLNRSMVCHLIAQMPHLGDEDEEGYLEGKTIFVIK